MKNLKIGTQLIFGFAALLLFVVILGIISYIQTDRIHQQTDTMYNHPLKVRRAIGHLQADIYAIHRDMKDLFISEGEKEMAFDLTQMENFKANAFDQIDLIYNSYLGPRADIDSVKKAFITWNSMREETIRLLRAGKVEEAVNRTKSNGTGGAQAEGVIRALEKIDDFARNKGDELYANSIELNKSLKSQLLFLVAMILTLSLLVIYFLMRNIRKPLAILTNTTRRFHEGNMDARSSYASQNEFGILSDSFNTLAGSIQENMDLSNKASAISGIMLSEDDAQKFFKSTLNAISTFTNSQMAAVYLLSDDKKTYQHFESFGLDEQAKQSFSANGLEGEFGSALLSCKVQHVKNVPDDTRFVFNTVSGKFIPREILTIPIVATDEVIAILSLATVNIYEKRTIQLIYNILGMLNSRVEGILAYRKMQELLEKLGQQNSELEAQKSEMAAQSAELVEQNMELEMQKKQLDEASRLKTNFLSNMSHELRTPLNSVIALSGVLNRRLANQIPKEEYDYLEVIQRNGKHLLSLINDILDISRIEAGREEVEMTKINLNNLVSELVSMIKPQAQQKNIELVYKEGDVNIFISSDGNKCRHILQNIIGNAVKFTEKGKVVVTARQSDKNIAIVVTDSGIGIAEDQLPHIFNEFRQADSSTSRKFGGTGLGLAIARKYANLLGGSISVRSKTGKGSEFTLILPLRYSPENRIIEEEAVGGFSITRTLSPLKPTADVTLKTVLLVEDSEPAIIQMKDILEENGYQIMVAHDGREALGIISHTIPDAMILDLMMPGIDGFEVLKTLREAEQTANIPVLILTAKHITKEELRFLTRNNVHQLIQKGDVNRNDLLNSVASMVFPETREAEKADRKFQTIEGKPLVLAVEDNPDNMLTVKALLADHYFVIEAADGMAGVNMAKKHKPNLILMDIELPVLDGIEAFKAIRADGQLQHIPIIALTASAMIQDRETILAHGFDAYVTKPIDEKTFFKTINDILYAR